MTTPCVDSQSLRHHPPLVCVCIFLSIQSDVGTLIEATVFHHYILSPQFTSCCHGAASFGNGMPYSGGSWCACVCPSPQCIVSCSHNPHHHTIPHHEHVLVHLCQKEDDPSDSGNGRFGFFFSSRERTCSYYYVSNAIVLQKMEKQHATSRIRLLKRPAFGWFSQRRLPFPTYKAKFY